MMSSTISSIQNMTQPHFSFTSSASSSFPNALQCSLPGVVLPCLNKWGSMFELPPISGTSSVPTRCSSSSVSASASASAVDSSTGSSRCSSVETTASLAGGKVRRGRPQQDIQDGSDAQSQKKKHRRLYARKYRLEMRQKIDNEKSLVEKTELLQRQKEQLESELAAAQQELSKALTLIQLMQIASIPRVY